MYYEDGRRVCSVEELWRRAESVAFGLTESRFGKGDVAFIDCQDQRFSLVDLIIVDLACLMTGLVVTTVERPHVGVVFTAAEVATAAKGVVISPAKITLWQQQSNRLPSLAVGPADAAYLDQDGSVVTHAQLWASVLALTLHEGRQPVVRDLTIHLGRETLFANRDVIYHQLCCGYSALVAPLWKPELFRAARPTFFIANAASIEAPMTYLLQVFDSVWFGGWAKKIALATPKSAISRAMNHMQWIIADTLIFPRVVSRAFGARLEWIYFVGGSAPPDIAHSSLCRGLGRPLINKQGVPFCF